MDMTFEQLKSENPAAYEQAQEIIGMCGDPTDPADTPTDADFKVERLGNGRIWMGWVTYGPFNPYPMWIWDPDAGEWVDNDEELDRYEELEGLPPIEEG